MKKALILGGNGFLGTYIIRELCEKKFQITVVSRTKKDIENIKTFGFPGQIVWQRYDITSPTLISDFNFKNYDVIINLIGIASQNQGNTYYKIHSEIPSQIAQQTRKLRVLFIHISALVPKIISSKYVKTKQEGEQAILKLNPNAVIIRPSVMIGTGDGLVSTFEKIINLSPVIPLLFGGKTKISPVFAGDVAKFIALSIEKTEMQGKTFTLCGKEVILFKDMIMKIAGFMNKRRFYISVPFAFFKLIFTIKSILPEFIFRTKLTKDLLDISKYEIIPEKNDLTLLVQNPQTIDDTLASMLKKYKLYD
jgi:NADH dehydrogenase